MEKSVHQNLHILRRFTHSQSLKMAMITQLFFSVSVFSLFFSHSSLLSFLHSLNFCFSTFPYQLFTHTIDKNCIFLICNGLLVFLAKYSGLARSFSSSSAHQDDQSHPKNAIEGSQSEFLVMLQKEEPTVLPENIGEPENVPMEELGNEKEYYFTDRGEIENEILDVREQEIESGSRLASNEAEEEEKYQQKEEETIVNVAEDEEKNDVQPNDNFLIGQKEEEEGEEEEVEEEEEVGIGVMSNEELNKRFDEFIRRMKEELRIEAQRQLIMV